MNKGSCTLSHLLKLDDASNHSELGARLSSQREKLQINVAVPWRKIQRKLIEAIIEQLKVPVLTLCTAAWKKYDELQEFADPKKYGPKEENEIDLLEHEIALEQHWDVEIVVEALRFKCPLPLDLACTLSLKGCTLTIRNGRIMKAVPGKGTGEASLKLREVVLAEVETNEVTLGEAADLGEGIPISQHEDQPVVPEPAHA